MSAHDFQKLKIGATVECLVTRSVSSGLVVTLDDGRTGIIRNRELRWDRSAGATPLAFGIGDRLQAFVLSVDQKSGLVELSRKRILSDPWERVRSGVYQKAQVVRGEVVNLTHDGAYLELEPGVDGFVPLAQIPGGATKRIEELLWFSDLVEAVITDVRHDVQLLNLSIIERLDKRSRDQTAQPRPIKLTSDGRGYTDLIQPGSEHYTQLKQHAGKRIHRICIIDDMGRFADGLADWLSRLGYEATPLKGASLEAFENNDFDLYLLDVDLGDIDGREIAKAILARSPDSRIILMTALDRVDEHEPLSEDLHLCGILLKPLDYGEVLALLLAVESTEPEGISLRDSSLGKRDQRLLEYVSDHLQPASDAGAAIQDTLVRLRTDTEADAVYLFKMEPFSLQVTVTACSVLQEGCLARSQLHLLKRSVVRNIAFDKETLHEGEAHTQGRFESLQRVFDFESCLGVPIPEVSPGENYALLILHRDVNHFALAHRTEAIAISSLLASYLRQTVVNSIVTRSQRSVLLGQIATSLLHELKNKLNVIGQETQNMELDIDEFVEKGPVLPTRVWAAQLRRRLSPIQAEYSDLRAMTFENLGIVGQEHLASININDLAEKTRRIIVPVAMSHQLRIQTRLWPRLPQITTIPLRLEQVFLNVALNAVQQMGLMHLPHCLLQIRTAYDEHDARYPVRVYFTDDGPGIHKPLWSRIFELGTTTRPDGTGLVSAAVRYCTSHSRPMCTRHVHPMCTRVTAPLLHIPYPYQHHRNGEAGRDDAGQEKNDRGHS